MPVCSGLEATARIRAHEKVRGLRPCFISALTAYASEEDRTECLSAGMDWFCTKPVSVEAIREALERCRQAKAAQAAPLRRKMSHAASAGDLLAVSPQQQQTLLNNPAARPGRSILRASPSVHSLAPNLAKRLLEASEHRRGASVTVEDPVEGGQPAQAAPSTAAEVVSSVVADAATTGVAAQSPTDARNVLSQPPGDELRVLVAGELETSRAPSPHTHTHIPRRLAAAQHGGLTSHPSRFF